MSNRLIDIAIGLSMLSIIGIALLMAWSAYEVRHRAVTPEPIKCPQVRSN